MEEVDIKLSTLEPFSTRGFPTVKPALPADIYVPLSVIYIVLYGLVFIYVYFQLILIWYFRHKRFSYQTTLLFLSLVWSALRIVLFSFYFQNAVDANKLFFVFYFILYCLPVILQFITLCLLVLYYGQVD
jgi:integral membrane protein GPR137